MKVKNVNIMIKPPKPKPREQIVFEKSKYAVIKFIDYKSKLFESIPESWFVNEERTACYWPPKTGRSFKLRAIKQDAPDWDWVIYECIVVSEGHATYSTSCAIVREKCSQGYNTSSADDHLEVAKYRREHPGLIQKGEKSFERLFLKAKNQEQQEKSSVEEILSPDSPKDTQNNNKDEFHPNIEFSENVDQRSQNSVPHDSGNQCSNSLENRHEIDDRSHEISRCSSRHSSRGSRKSSNRNRSRSSRRNRSHESSRHSSRRSSRGSRKSSNRNRSRSSQPNRSHESSRRSSRRSSSGSRKSSNRNRSRSSRRNRSHESSRCSSRRSSRGSRKSSSQRSRHRTHKGSSRSRQLTRERQRKRSASSQRSETPLSYMSISPGTSKKAANRRPSRGRGAHSLGVKNHKLSSRVCEQSNSKVDQQENRQSKQFSSSFRLTCNSATSTDQPFQGQQNNHLKTLMYNVNQLTKIIMKDEHRNKQNDRRISRMEITVNKSFVLIGDLVSAFNMRMSLGHFSKKVPIPKGYKMPEFPMESRRDLRNLNHDLKNKNFFLFLVNDQKQYCTPSEQSTNNVVMTAFLKRFISVSMRAKVVLKDLKGQKGYTLCANYPRVYDFIIQVFKAGYEIRSKVMTDKEVHAVLRVVWGRSKQLLNEGNRRLKK